MFVSDHFRLYETLKCLPGCEPIWTLEKTCIGLEFKFKFDLFLYCWNLHCPPNLINLNYISSYILRMMEHILFHLVAIPLLRMCCRLFAGLFSASCTNRFLSKTGEVFYITEFSVTASPVWVQAGGVAKCWSYKDSIPLSSCGFIYILPLLTSRPEPWRALARCELYNCAAAGHVTGCLSNSLQKETNCILKSSTNSV